MNLSIEEINKIIPEGNNKQKFITSFYTFSKYPDFDKIQINQSTEKSHHLFHTTNIVDILDTTQSNLNNIGNVSEENLNDSSDDFNKIPDFAKGRYC